MDKGRQIKTEISTGGSGGCWKRKYHWVLLVLLLCLGMTATAGAATLTVRIEPETAREAGAQWKLYKLGWGGWYEVTGWKNHNTSQWIGTGGWDYYRIVFSDAGACTKPGSIEDFGSGLVPTRTGTYSCPVSDHIIDASVSGGVGSISPSGSRRVNDGDDQTFSFTPDRGYEIGDVVVDGVSQGAVPSYTFHNVTADHTISVSFSALPSYTISASAGSNGSISPSGSKTVYQGESQAYTMTPDTGYQVDSVIVDGIDLGAVDTHTFTNISADHQISVSFEKKTYTISAGAGAGGLITPSGSVDVLYQEDQSFTITPDMGYEVEEVDVDGAPQGPISSYTFSNVTDDHTITATFKIPDVYYTITASSGADGTISPSGAVSVLQDTDKTFTMIPADGYQVDDVKVDGASVGVVNAYTFTSVSGDHTIHVTFASVLPPTSCVDITDTPLAAQLQAAPANIMFILDDSGSMDWEMMTTEADGIFNRGSYDFAYVYNMSDNQDSGTGTDELSDSSTYMRYWKSQFSRYNRMYYNPVNTYDPWPNKTNASPTAARSNPQNASPTLNLTSQYTSNGSLSIKNAHYYVWYDADGDGNWVDETDPGNDADPDEVYLINLDGGLIRYYRWNGEGPSVEGPEVTLVATPPDAVVPKNEDGTPRTYTEELQNFANWFSYYRRREYAAKAAVANVIDKMSGVQIGFFSIQERLIQSVLKVRVQEATFLDYSATLLTSLYDNYNSTGGTPLRSALKNVGRYYDKDDGYTGGIGSSPYASETDGGGCQQSFAILMTDGFYNGSSPSVGNQDQHEGVPYADTYSETLADVAMKFYKEDLANTIANEVPTSFLDSATHQHMITYTVSFGVNGTLNPDDFDLFNTDPSKRKYPTWPNPGSGDQQKIDDMWHASVNGRGSFLNASDPQELVDSLVSVMQNINSRTVSDASVSVNGEELQAGTTIFQSSYTSDGWSGDVKAYGLDATTGEVLRDTSLWSARNILDTQAWDTGRNIATFNGTNGVAFLHGNLSASQQALLTSDEVDYLRGKTDLEVQNGGTFRNRAFKLGDIVHSAPLYEDDVLYVGANDGMLHAFKSSNGEELFAYVPDLVFSNLKRLTETTYSHKFYVDLTPYARTIGSNTYLIGGLGKGGQGYFMLDITDPESNTQTNAASWVKWEYPTTSTPASEKNNLGYSYSQAYLVQSNDAGIGGNGWVVIFGNGYNSANGHAVLFVLNAATGQLVKTIDTGVNSCNGLSTPVPVDVDQDSKMDYIYAGDLKGNLWKFDMTATSSGSWEIAYKEGATPVPLFQARDASGYSQPITGKPDVMRHCKRDGYMVIFGTGRYLGSTDFDTTASQTLYGIWDYGDDDDNSEYLGSFTRPGLSNQPTTTEQKGSIQLLAQTQVDWRTIGSTSYRTLSANEANWETIDDSTGGQSADIGSDTAGQVVHAGWYFDLPSKQGQAGHERIISDVIVRSGNVIVTTFNPNKDTPCSAGGSSMVHELNACTGGRLSAAQFDTNDDDLIDENDLINIGTPQDPLMVPPSGLHIPGRLFRPVIVIIPRTTGPDIEAKYFSSTSGSIPIVREKTEQRGMFYWRQVVP